MKFLYTVWFRDPYSAAEDQDHEWPACYVIEASDDLGALAWGDRIALSYSRRQGQELLFSSVESFGSSSVPGKEGLPVVGYGEEIGDDEIGW